MSHPQSTVIADLILCSTSAVGCLTVSASTSIDIIWYNLSTDTRCVDGHLTVTAPHGSRSGLGLVHWRPGSDPALEEGAEGQAEEAADRVLFDDHPDDTEDALANQ